MHGLSITVLQCACLLAFAAAGSGKELYEWAGIFEVPDAKYMWISQTVKGKYADDDMKIAIIPTVEANAADLSASVPGAKLALKKTCVTIKHGDVLTPGDGKCYKLEFDKTLWQSYFVMDTTGFAHVAIFAQHVPTEFENTAHYLKDTAGEDVEPSAELPEKAEAVKVKKEKKPDWGASIGAAIIVSFITLIGVVLAVPAFKKLFETHGATVEAILAAFAAGTLLACAFFLLLFEATHLVQTGWAKEVEVLWRWGTMVLAGFILPAVIESPLSLLVEAKGSETRDSETEAGDSETKASETKLSRVAAVRVLGAVTIGDFLHNLCDGFFIGAAFKGCGSKFGWTVSLSTILHELPQELADYAILTSPGVGLTPVKALLLNFLAGLSVILGVIIINVIDLPDSTVGLFLAFGGGTYVYLAAVECMPKVHNPKLPAGVRMLCLLVFIFGTVLIGLILLDHEHCVPDTDEPKAAGGHAHGH